ncbi:unnamed protein product [Closterium sp. Naga37s-1]|nr:unnamed protein product [Closterium sp. Naga37s-1]
MPTLPHILAHLVSFSPPSPPLPFPSSFRLACSPLSFSPFLHHPSPLLLPSAPPHPPNPPPPSGTPVAESNSSGSGGGLLQATAVGVLVVLEGGYNLESIEQCFAACVSAMLGDLPIAAPPPQWPLRLSQSGLATVLQVRKHLSQWWPCLASPLDLSTFLHSLATLHASSSSTPSSSHPPTSFPPHISSTAAAPPALSMDALFSHLSQAEMAHVAATAAAAAALASAGVPVDMQPTSPSTPSDASIDFEDLPGVGAGEVESGTRGMGFRGDGESAGVAAEGTRDGAGMRAVANGTEQQKVREAGVSATLAAATAVEGREGGGNGVENEAKTRDENGTYWEGIEPESKPEEVSLKDETRERKEECRKEEETLVWYASYGSNMLEERFMCYIQGGAVDGMTHPCHGCSDPTPPRASKWIAVPHRMCDAAAAAAAAVGASASTAATQQPSPSAFHEILPDGWYGTVLLLGFDDGCPILTFRSAPILTSHAPLPPCPFARLPPCPLTPLPPCLHALPCAQAPLPPCPHAPMLAPMPPSSHVPMPPCSLPCLQAPMSPCPHARSHASKLPCPHAAPVFSPSHHHFD